MSMSKVWFVTGASSGIGTGVVKSALQAGHRVVATARNLEKLRAALGEGDGERLALMKLDVTQEAQAAAVVEAAVARFGAVDVLVNNAGYFLLGSFESFTNAQLERQFATNFYGVAHLMRAVLPVMRRQRSGYIFNISSMAGLLGFKEAGAYAATKFAVEGLSQSVAQEVEPFGIKVIAVEPGFFRTELVAPQSMDYGERAVEGYAPLETLKAAWATYHHQQPGDPSKLGAALLELAAMEKPPRQFLAGSDAVAGVEPALEARLKEIRTHAALSKSTDGTF